MDVNRRQLLRALAGLPIEVAGYRRSHADSFSVNRIRIGAIRWDAWYGADRAQGSPEWHATQNLDPPHFRRRAPFFSKQLGDGQFRINGMQADMDEEIKYAADAGIDFWAFCWYPAGRPLHVAWELYEKSPRKSLVNWCAIFGLNSFGYNSPGDKELLEHFSSNRYEKVCGDRPLVFLLHEKADLKRAALSLKRLRDRCTAQNIKTPYVVVQCAAANIGALDARAIGADAISAYASVPKLTQASIPYPVLDQHLRNFWLEMAATGLPVVPDGMTGWDVRPRMPPQPISLAGSFTGSYVLPGTFEEVADHIEALVKFAQENRQLCPAQIALIYSWNECDEGGSVLCPTWTPFGADTTILNAVSKKIRS